MIDKHYKKYKNFGKCLEISNGEIKALITVDIGPRIIFYGYKGFNILFEDKTRFLQKSGEFFDTNFKEGEKWFAYGGHRLWRAKEDMGSYVPDNYPVKVERTERGAIFTPRVQEYTKLQLVMKVEMDDDGKLNIYESFENTADEPQKLAPWGITAIRAGGTEIIPLNAEDTGFLPCQNLVFWPYNDVKDRRIKSTKKYAILKQNKKTDRPFKLGLFNCYGWVGYSIKNYLYVRKFKVEQGELPDFYCNYETYTKNDYMEMEYISKFVTLNKGEKVNISEKFEIHKNVVFDSFTDEDIDKTIKEIL